MKMNKITVFGAGKVGSAVVQLSAYKNLGDIVLFNRTLEKAQGLALDILESSSIEDFDGQIVATSDYKDTKDSDVIVITAGLPRKEGMAREQLLNENAQIVKSIAEESAKHSKNAFYIVVTNPLDAMAYVAYKFGKLKREEIVGMAGTLDTSRFNYFIAEELKVPARQVKSLVLGTHGDTMVPIISQTTVNGKPLARILSQDKINKLVERTRNAGAEIISYLKDSAFYAPASAVVQLVESVLQDRHETLPCSVYLKGEYGIEDTFLGAPAVLGRKGVEKILEIGIAPEEQAGLDKSAIAVKATITQLKL